MADTSAARSSAISTSSPSPTQTGNTTKKESEQRPLRTSCSTPTG
jgi:hypothetical protein